MPADATHDDATLDAAAIDAPMGPDGGRDGAASDAAPVDAGPPTCEPGCPATERCCGATCVSRTGTPPGLDGRDDPSFSNCNGCGLACDPVTASACSVPIGMTMPRCVCGNGGACTAPETCERNGDAFECACGPIGPCPAGHTCHETGGSYGCADLDFDELHCGSIGNACPLGATCVLGVCRCGGDSLALECAAPNRGCAASCIDVSSDATNCGSCGMVCGPDEGCFSGSCGCGVAGRHCADPTTTSLGEACCAGSCVPNTDASCLCEACDTSAGRHCLRDTGFFGPNICCGDPSRPSGSRC